MIMLHSLKKKTCEREIFYFLEIIFMKMAQLMLIIPAFRSCSQVCGPNILSHIGFLMGKKGKK